MSRAAALSGGCQRILEGRAVIDRMGTGHSHTDENTAWLEVSLIAARQGPDTLRVLSLHPALGPFGVPRLLRT